MHKVKRAFNQKGIMAKVTEQQKTLCRHVAEGMRICDAAIAAGYKESSASSSGGIALNKHHVREYLNKLREKIEGEFIISSGIQLDRLQAVYDKAMKANQMNAAVGALKEMNSIKGYHAPKQSEVKLDSAPMPIEEREKFMSTVFAKITGDE